MADPYRDLSKREQAEADQRAADAAEIAAHAISGTLAKVATVAAAAATKRAPADAVRDLRIAVQPERKDDAARAEAVARRLILASMTAGYLFDSVRRAEIIEKHSELAITVATDVARPKLAAFPIGGYTVAELATSLRQRLERAIDTTLTLPLSGALPAEAIPAALGEVARQHADRVAGAVAEAYHAGSRASVLDIGDALGGDGGDAGISITAPPDEPLDGNAVWFQYHTQHDNRVRPSHAALDGTVWRVDDPKAPTPPIDWGCRCFLSFCSAPGHDALPPPSPPREGSAAARVITKQPHPVARSAVYAAYLDQHADGWRALMARAADHKPAGQLAYLIDGLRATGRDAADARDLANMVFAVFHD